MKEPMMADSHEITVRNYKQPMRNRLIMMLICIGIALASFFVVSKWATSVESYRWVIKTLNGLQKKALGLSGTATALATGAAAIPGEAATPIANKLADVAGYMVIVYAVIIVEKYLLTITGYIAFKILFPIGCVLLAAGNFLKNGWKEFIYRIGIKSIILGVLLWGLVPTSAWVTNMVNETYAKSYEADFTLEDTEELLDEGDTSVNADKKDEAQETKDKKFSFSEFLNNAKDKVDDAIDAVGEVATEKLSVFEDGLNRIIEGVAVLLVTTCAIPVLVMLSFTWILKEIMGLKIPSITLQSVPRVSERKRKKTEEN